MRYLVLPAILALAYLANEQVPSPPGAVSAPADQPALAAPQEDTKDRLRGAVDSVLNKQSLRGQALIDDTQRPPADPLLRAQDASPGRYWIEGLPNNYFVLLDTQTGHCWIRSYTDAKWRDLGSPAEK